MRIALVHDYLTQLGGAERVLKVLMEIFPYAPVFTLLYDEERLSKDFPKKRIRTSFLQKLPFAKTQHRLFPVLMPYATEQFDLSAYDVVLSASHSFVKGVITRPETLHICYCYTPMRYTWDDSHRYIREFRFFGPLKPIIPFALNYLRLWDRLAADRVDEFITISHFVARRIKKYYQRKAKVIYPPVETKYFLPKDKQKDYFLIVSRLLPYKRLDIAVEAFSKLGLLLKIIGTGPEEKKLKKIAKPNVEFLGRLPDEEVKKYYAECLAFIFPQEEDFGIAPLEANAAGRPVIAFRGGGALESIVPGKNGIFFNEQTPESLATAVKNFDPSSFDPKIIRQHALQFDTTIFKRKMKEYVESAWHKFSSCH